MPFRRDLFTGKLKKYKHETPRGRAVLSKARQTRRSSGSVWGTPWVSRGPLALENPAQWKQYNEAMKSQGVTGAYYTSDGVLHCETNGARNSAMKFLNAKDLDAGYRQYAGR